MPDRPTVASDRTVQQSTLERHIQTIMQLVVVGLLAWAGDRLTELQQIAVRQEERLITLSASLKTTEGRVQNLEADQIDILIRLDRLEQKQ